MKPLRKTLNKREEAAIIKMFTKETKNARTISDTIGVPHRQVMALLEDKGLKTYASGSYN